MEEHIMYKEARCVCIKKRNGINHAIQGSS